MVSAPRLSTTLLGIPVVLLALGIGGPGQLAYGDLVVPADLNAGDKYHIIFVTSSTTQGNLGGVSGANNFVSSVASFGTKTAGTGVTWQAIISASFGANTKITDNFPIYRTDGTRIADSYANMFAADLFVPINLDENGNTLPVNAVWTGSSATGAPEGARCGNFTGTTFDSIVGRTFSTDSTWVSDTSTYPCLSYFPLYGISSAITAVPEPSSVLFLSCACLAVIGKRLVSRTGQAVQLQQRPST